MKHLLPLVIILLLSAFEGEAQGYQQFRASLNTPDSLRYSTVSATEHGSAAVLNNHITARQQESIDGYRITIYLNKGQHARTEAFEARDKFRMHFPGVATFVAYEDPYWVVSVGNCTTSDSAMILLGRVSGLFEKAYLIRAAIPVEEFTREEPIVRAEGDNKEGSPSADGVPANI